MDAALSYPASGPAPLPLPSKRRLRAVERTDHPEALFVKRHAPGTAIFSAGEPATHVYEVTQGLVMLYRHKADGRRLVVDLIAPGRMFGFSTSAAHDCHAKALTSAVVCASATHLAQSDPAFAQRLTNGMRDDIRHLRDLAFTLGRKSAVERIATLLLQLSAAHGGGDGTLDLPLSRSDMADHLGLTVETVSRNITRMKGMGLIATRNATKIIIRDSVALGALAEGADERAVRA